MSFPVHKVEQFIWCIDLLLATILGFFIGLERKLRNKEAGIKTHTIVSFGAALMMLVSIHAFSEADKARVAAQIVTGVGFLGAGIIVYRKNVAHGLTTAAGIWTTAGIGMACAGGLYIIAITATGLMILIHLILHNKIFAAKKGHLIKILFEQNYDERESIKKLFEIERFNSLIVKRVEEQLVYQAIIQTEQEYSSQKVDEIMKEHRFILLIERVDIE